MTAVVGPGSPYLSPAMLVQMPLGISWSTIPSRNSSIAQQNAAQLDMCQTASGMVDGYCNQVLRCTSNVEYLSGPNYRLTVDNSTGEGRAIMSRSPVTSVVGVQVSSGGTYPRQWNTLPAGMFEPENPVMGVYGSSSPSDSGEGGQAIRIAPGFIDWGLGRNGYRAKITYTNGWPHCGTVEAVAAGASVVQVDDCTGWAPPSSDLPGATGIIFDGAIQEAVTCIDSSAVTGPGTLTLAAPLMNGHPPGSLLSCLPGNIRWATALFAATQALTRGATSTTIQTLSPGATASKSTSELSAEAELLLQPFRRVI